MKKYMLVSLVVGAAIVALLGTQVLSQKLSTKIEAFHESLKLETTKEYRKSIQALEGIYKTHKDDYLVNLRLGWLQYLSENYSESNRYYTLAYTLSGNKSIEALLGKSLPLSAENKWDEVAGVYKTILKLDHMHYTANLRLGQIQLNKSSYVEAKKYLEVAYNLYPGSFEPNLSLGWTSYYLGDRERATSLFTTALMLSPGDELAQKGLNLLK